MDISVEASGAREATRKLDKVGDALVVEMNEAVERVIRDVERELEVRVPVETGFLRSTIDAKAMGSKGSVEVHAEYAEYVEYGTSDTPAQPFITPAFEKGRKLLAEHGREALRRVVDEV